MNSAADLGARGIFIVLDATALAFVQTTNRRDRLNSDHFKGGTGTVSLFTLSFALETFTRDTV